MQSSNIIIELIDGYLERLIEARRLLAEFDLVAATVVPTRATKLKSTEKKKLAAARVPVVPTPRLALRKTLKPELKKMERDTATAFHRAVVKKPEPEIRVMEKKTLPPTLPVFRSRVRVPSRKKSVAVKPSMKTGTLTLGGKIPTGPIVVSAQQIRIEQSLRQEEFAAERGLIPSPDSSPLTAELLAQRWLQPSKPSAS